MTAFAFDFHFWTCKVSLAPGYYSMEFYRHPCRKEMFVFLEVECCCWCAPRCCGGLTCKKWLVEMHQKIYFQNNVQYEGEKAILLKLETLQ